MRTVAGGYLFDRNPDTERAGPMTTSEEPERLGRLDDSAEEQESSSTTEGPAAAGEYDPAQGSPGEEHAIGEDFPDEAVRYDEPGQRPRSDTQE